MNISYFCYFIDNKLLLNIKILDFELDILHQIIKAPFLGTKINFVHFFRESYGFLRILICKIPFFLSPL